MIEVSNNAVQTIAPGGMVAFNVMLLESGRAECFRSSGSMVNISKPGIYKLHFTANITSGETPGAVQLALQYNGNVLEETQMMSYTSAENQYNNVSCMTMIAQCVGSCGSSCGGSITVVNNGSTSVTIAANPSLIVSYEG